jgi:hypothetical protein
VAPPKVKTSEIYWGAVPFVIIQIIMVGLVIAFPNLVQHDKPAAGTNTTIELAPSSESGDPAEGPTLSPAEPEPPAESAPAGPASLAPSEETPAASGARAPEPDLAEVLRKAQETDRAASPAQR